MCGNNLKRITKPTGENTRKTVKNFPMEYGDGIEYGSKLDSWNNNSGKNALGFIGLYMNLLLLGGLLNHRK